MTKPVLNGRHALVCGASAGIGRASAIALAQAGARVTVLARRLSQLQQVVAELQDLGAAEPAYRVADLERTEDITGITEALLRERGQVHILVNNAGGPAAGPILAAQPAEFDGAFRRHVLASHLLTQAVVPGMAAAGYGRIINIISISVREPLPNLGVSNTIRGAMASWAKSVARELPPGVTINNVLPGYTDTERLRSLLATLASKGATTPEWVERQWLAGVPEGRLASPDEIAAAVVFLASPAAGYVRGVSLPVDGGRLGAL